MTTLPVLTASHARTYEKIFQHPISHNLEWHEVRTLLAELGQIADQPNGHLLISRNGHTLVVHRPHTKDITDIHELLEIRHFLERSETPSLLPTSPGQVLVVISHHQARVFHSLGHGSQAHLISSAQPSHFRHAPDSNEFSRGEEEPAPSSLFQPLAEALKDACTILLFGSGSGSASEMDVFSTWLKKSQPLLAARIIGSLVVDESHLTEGELLEKARIFYVSLLAAKL